VPFILRLVRLPFRCLVFSLSKDGDSEIVSIGKHSTRSNKQPASLSWKNVAFDVGEISKHTKQFKAGMQTAVAQWFQRYPILSSSVSAAVASSLGE